MQSQPAKLQLPIYVRARYNNSPNYFYTAFYLDQPVRINACLIFADFKYCHSSRQYAPRRFPSNVAKEQLLSKLIKHAHLSIFTDHPKYVQFAKPGWTSSENDFVDVGAFPIETQAFALGFTNLPGTSSSQGAYELHLP